MKNIKVILITFIVLIFILTFFLMKRKKNSKSRETSYRTVSQKTAVQMMKDEKNYIIIDVRTIEEYSEGHIPNAISLPVQNIGNGENFQLPDKNQLILLYCRSGSRSRQAAQKLVEKGYANVVDFGGINKWIGEIVK